MSFSISGKTAIVTGAGSGIGLAIARHFVDKGANVMFADPDEDLLEAEVGEEARADGPVRMFAGDLCQKLSVTNLLTATVDAFDRIDILVNANRRMAVSDPLVPDADAVADLFRENALAGLRLTQLAARRMIQAAAPAEGDGPRNLGAVINLSSIAAQDNQPGLLAYGVAAGAIEHMTRTMAVALAPHGIRVNAVSFGSLLSASLQSALKDAPESRQPIVAGTPLARIAAPDELVETVQFLASDAASFITGQVLRVDGGRSLLGAVQVPAY